MSSRTASKPNRVCSPARLCLLEALPHAVPALPQLGGQEKPFLSAGIIPPIASRNYQGIERDDLEEDEHAQSARASSTQCSHPHHHS